jgi:hypothetical protein
MPAHQRPRRIGQLPALAVAYTFDDPLPDADIATWKVIGDSAGPPHIDPQSSCGHWRRYL